jgi:hypothetical protein
MTGVTPVRRAARLALGLSLVASLAVARASSAGAAPPPFAPADVATVHPGVLLITDHKGCTANFVFTDAAGHYYLGEAAHCVSKGEPQAFNGCTDAVLPLGTAVEIDGSDVPGTLAYSSWATMQAIAERDSDTCRTNDFALIRLPDDARRTLNPSVPHFGGPTGLSLATADTGESVYSYGNSPLREGISSLSPKEGVVLDRTDGDWTFLCYFLTPAIPGDSGSGVLDEQGRALGVASSLNFLPHPASNGVVNLPKALAYAVAHSGIPGLQLVPGTEPFAQ